MSECCELHAPGGNCDQGRKCPVRAARMAGAVGLDDADTKANDDTLFNVVMVITGLLSLLIFCGVAGWFWGRYSKGIQQAWWLLASTLS